LPVLSIFAQISILFAELVESRWEWIDHKLLHRDLKGFERDWSHFGVLAKFQPRLKEEHWKSTATSITSVCYAPAQHHRAFEGQFLFIEHQALKKGDLLVVISLILGISPYLFAFSVLVY
jgi:hypothetical protein